MKKIFSFILVMVMLLISVSMTATVFAGEKTCGVGDIVEYGLYPQSEVKGTIRQALSELAGDVSGWISYNYYSGNGSCNGQMTTKDYAVYKDVIYKGEKYRGVYFTEKRPSETSGTSGSNYFGTYDNYFSFNQYWFRFEPIKWKILDPSTGLVVAESILDSQAYNNYCLNVADEYYGDSEKSFFSNNWEKSSIRKWLNNDFLNTAFAATEQDKIKTAFLSTHAYTDAYLKYDSADTEDKVFLLSFDDVYNTKYGFAPFRSFTSRNAKASSYAESQGCLVYRPSGSPWWLRSAGMNSHSACFVTNSSESSEYSSTNETAYGVRPALYFKDFSFVTCNHLYKEAVIHETCTTDGYTVHTCNTCGYSYIDNFTVATGHAEVIDNAVLATCTENGFTEGKHCSVCNAVIVEREVVAARGHTFGEWKTVKEPTANEDGLLCRTCSVCDAEDEKVLSAVGEKTKLIKFVNIDKMHYVLNNDGEDYIIYHSSTINWYTKKPLTFTVYKYTNAKYQTVRVRVDGKEIEADKNGIYTVPAGEKNAVVTVEAEVKNNDGEKLSFWEMLVNFFRTIKEFFEDLFGR